MKKFKILIALVLSITTLVMFSQETEKQKKDVKTQTGVIVKPDNRIKPGKGKIPSKGKIPGKKVEYPGVEWKPKQELNEYPGVEWRPKHEELTIIDIEKVGDETEAGLQVRIAEAERRVKIIVEERRRLSKLKSHYKEVMLKSKRKLAKLQGETQEQTFTEEELRERAQSEELEKAKDYDVLERIVAMKGRDIKFKKNQEYVLDYSLVNLASIVKAVKKNGHARLIIGIKKKGAGLANVRVKYLKSKLAEMGLVPNIYRVSKLSKNAKSKYWLSENNHMWFRVEHL